MCGAEVFHVKYNDRVLQTCTHINQLEFITLVVALQVWGEKLARQKVIIKCDNMNTVRAMNSGVSRDEVMQACLRRLHILMAIYSCEVKGVHCPAEENRIPDSLSRLHLHSKFGDKLKALTAGKTVTLGGNKA